MINRDICYITKILDIIFTLESYSIKFSRNCIQIYRAMIELFEGIKFNSISTRIVPPHLSERSKTYPVVTGRGHNFIGDERGPG